MSNYFLIDCHNKSNIYLNKAVEVWADLLLYYNQEDICTDMLKSKWTYSDPLPLDFYSTFKNKKLIKKHVGKLNIAAPIWNNDFIHGLAQNGTVKNNQINFNSVTWKISPVFENIFKDCPFSGYKKFNKKNFTWLNTLVLSFPYNEKAISFMAGVIAGGEVVEGSGNDPKIKNKYVNYMRYGNNVLPWLQKWNIPIEKKDNKFIYISPFWAALFIPWMPDYYKEWAKIKRACSAEEYALIMWRIFVDVDPRVDAIPYLICRRTYYYRYHSIKGLEKKWVENHLTQIDDRIKQAVHFWAKVV